MGEGIDETKLEEGRRTIESMYSEDGYTEATVTYATQPGREPGFSIVTYSIDEGERSFVRKIGFEGNTLYKDSELRKLMKTKPRSALSFITKSGRINTDVLEDDVLRVEEHYQNAGYIDAEVVDVEKVRVGGKKVDLILSIAEGEKYAAGAVDLEGVNLFPADEIRSRLKMVEGVPFSAGDVRSDIKAIEDYYGARGHADARVTPETSAAGPLTISLTYVVEEGEKSYVNLVHIEGNTKTKDKVVRRELAVAPGDEFNTVLIDASRRRLENLGYFSRVEVLRMETGNRNRKDLNVIVEEKSTGSVNFGVGFSSIDNLVGFIDVVQTNFDLFKFPGFTGAGQKFRVNLRYGTERRDFVMSLVEPWFMGKRLALGGEVFYRDMAFLSDVYEQTNYGGTIHLRKPLGKYAYVRTDYTLRNVEIRDVPENASEFFQEQAGTYLQSRLGMTLNYDTRDSIYLPRRGHRINLGGNLSGGFLGGDVDTYGVTLGAVKHFLMPLDTILTLKGDIAFADTWSGGEEVPVFDRLFLGGANNLRGFDYRDVGPKDEFGEPIGGRSSAFFSAEVTFPIIEKVRGAVFYDIGQVSLNSWDFGGSWNSDVGFGLRLYLPVGPINLDFGIPIQSDEWNDSNGKFNFKIGYQF